MRVSLIINGHEVGDYIAEGGISFDQEERYSKELTTMNGTKYQKKIYKRTISVTLLDNLYDGSFQTLCGWFSTNPAAVTYSNLETGLAVTGTFYISEPKYNAKKALTDTITLVSGGSFDLTEQ